MKRWLKGGWLVVRGCVLGILQLLLWTSWLALVVLLGIQAWIATSNELAVPGVVLRSLEQRLAVSNIRITFGQARFDPTGRILLDDVRLFLPAYREPIAAAQSVYVELDPWALFAGKVDPHRVHLTGARFAIPAMLSHSGRSEDVLSELDATVTISPNDLLIEHLTARVAGISAAAHGGFHLTSKPGQPAQSSVPLPEYLARQYPDFCRQLIRVADRLTVLQQPELHVDLAPSNARGAFAQVVVTARAVNVEEPYRATARGITLTTRFPLQGEAPVVAPLQLSVDQLALANEVTIQHLSARLRGVFHPSQYTFDPRDVQLTLAEAAGHGFSLEPLSAHVRALPLPRVHAEIIAGYEGLPLALGAEADLKAHVGTVQVEGMLSQHVLDPIGAAMQRDLHRYIGFGRPLDIKAGATFGPGWKFERLAGRFRAWEIDADHVPMDTGGGDFEFDGRHFNAHDAFVTLGENFARGTFEQDLSDFHYRFLLEGKLRPIAIGAWFGKWWENFFEAFAFADGPPKANVDVAGRWRHGQESNVFVAVETPHTSIQGVAFDYARGLLFIRPHFVDGLELFGTIGAGGVRGTFTRQIEPYTFGLVAIDLDVVASVPLDVPGQLFGPSVGNQLTPFRFDQVPTVKLRGRFEGPAAPDGEHQWLQIESQSTGKFEFYGFPLSNLSFKASIHDDEVKLDDLSVGFAGGIATGTARAWGRGDNNRRLGFDVNLRGGSLGQAVRTLEEFNAKSRGAPPPLADKFVQDKAGVKLDLAASAEGAYADPYSYHGQGHATLEGGELAEIHMLGMLSQLLSFTSLRFTAARANFGIDGPQLNFQQVDITGANSAIEAHGSYHLRNHTLDFKARVSPFRESKFLPSMVIGAVLTPFTSVLQVKLNGTLDNPTWAFVNGPTNFFRKLTRQDEPEPPPPPPANPDFIRR